MLVYFIRHGQTALNEQNIHQATDTPLDETGKRQAAFLSKRLAGLPIDTIVASPLVRTQQTVEIINRSLKLEVEYNDGLRETRRPSEFYGHHHLASEIALAKEEIQANFTNANWYYSDEENPRDIIDRATAFIRHLEGRSERALLVVTHANILRAIIYTMILGDHFTLPIYQDIYYSLRHHNTGLTVCEYHDHTWKLITWNDVAHLGET